MIKECGSFSVPIACCFGMTHIMCAPSMSSPVHADSSVLSQPGNLGTCLQLVESICRWTQALYFISRTFAWRWGLGLFSGCHLYVLGSDIGFLGIFPLVGWPPLFSSSLASYPIVDCLTHIFWLTPYSGSRIQSPLDFVTFNLQRPWSWKLWHQTAHHRAEFARFLPT